MVFLEVILEISRDQLVNGCASSPKAPTWLKQLLGIISKYAHYCKGWPHGFIDLFRRIPR